MLRISCSGAGSATLRLYSPRQSGSYSAKIVQFINFPHITYRYRYCRYKKYPNLCSYCSVIGLGGDPEVLLRLLAPGPGAHRSDPPHHAQETPEGTYIIVRT